MPGETTAAAPGTANFRALGRAWVALCFAVALHVADETATDFLSVYNPTVLYMRHRIPWLPLPVFRFEVWLGGLIAAVCIALAVSPVFFRGGGRLRPVGWIVGVLMIANGVSHTLGTIFGRTIAPVYFRRPMPGFYSSPVLIAAAIWLLVELRRSSQTLRLSAHSS